MFLKDYGTTKGKHGNGTYIIIALSLTVTTADGTWQTKDRHCKNAAFTIRNYLNGALLYYEHLCQKGSNDVVEGDLYPGTSKSSEGYAARITFQKAKEKGLNVAVHWQDADSSSAKAFRKVFPRLRLCYVVVTQYVPTGRFWKTGRKKRN